MQKSAIELKNITKAFGSVVANVDVSLSCARGEILALLGENGSGKTTLMNMVSGIYKPLSGEIYVNGEHVQIDSPAEAIALGIGMVHQHFKLVESFSGYENILLGSRGVAFRAGELEKIDQTVAKYGMKVDLSKKISDMAVAEKQTLEIIKVLYHGADILILDEPTAVLTAGEIDGLFSVLREMKAAGCAVIIITHKLAEVLELSDRVAILRKGRSVGEVKTSGTTAHELTELMVGHETDLKIDRPSVAAGGELLKLEGLTIAGDEGLNAIDDVSFSVYGGEILGVAGISGCGQKELCECIAGLTSAESGLIEFKGEDITHASPRDIIKKGISMSFIPEDRLGMGLSPSLSIADNMILKSYSEGGSPLLDKKRAVALAERVVEELEVAAPSVATPVRRLSGGNIQKILVGRETEHDPALIVTAYPVRGLDINSSYNIYGILNREKQKGTGVLFVGEDLDVLLELCDRIVVLRAGRVAGIVEAAASSKEELGALMVGSAKNEQLEIEQPDVGARFIAPSAPSRPAPSRRGGGKSREPFFKLQKRDELTLLKKTVFYVGAILAALILGAIFIAANGVNPLEYYLGVVTSCFRSPIRTKSFIAAVTPLVITSVGLSFAFKARFWNIGANGQFLMGAIFGNLAGLLLGESLPQAVTLLVMAVFGIAGGMLFGLIPAFFNIKFGTNETLLTLMLNYVAYYTATYIKNLTFFRRMGAAGASTRPEFKPLPEGAFMLSFKLGGVTIDLSFVLALLIVALAFVYFSRTKQGYELAVVGDSRATAKYAGMNVNKIMLRTMLISAGVVGLGGMLQVSGGASGHTFSEGLTNDVGWTGIIVAWLAKLSPAGILLVSGLLSILVQGCGAVQDTFKIAGTTSEILEGIILFSVLVADFLISYRLILRKRGAK